MFTSKLLNYQRVKYDPINSSLAVTFPRGRLFRVQQMLEAQLVSNWATAFDAILLVKSGAPARHDPTYLWSRCGISVLRHNWIMFEEYRGVLKYNVKHTCKYILYVSIIDHI